MMASWLSHFSPFHGFPAYHGQYPVGTVDVEIPAADLPQPCETPDDAPPTVAFRIFYPCVKPPSSEVDRPVRWIPQPQRLNVAALIKFLGISERKSSALSYLTQWFYYININAHRNAKVQDAPTSNSRWPVTFFSHGLAGSRNAYSYICGDMASNGMVVIAMDHRDGSSPLQYVRATDKTEAYSIPAIKISHEARKEVWEARDRQLRIRLWEISMIYEALLKIDEGEKVENLDENTSKSHSGRIEVLQRFKGMLDIEAPGKVSWAGHSFGACTVAQLVKSVYYSQERPQEAGKPLIRPASTAPITQQITPDSPTILLDTWCLPFQSPEQKYLFDRPMPSYARGGPHGTNILSILSEGFANWHANLNQTKSLLAPPPRSRRPSRSTQPIRERAPITPQWARLRDESPSRDSGYASASASVSPARSSSASSRVRPAGPHVFYVQRSQHFSQSDFGVLFPNLSRYLAKAEEPERILELNARAIVEVLRGCGVEVAGGEEGREMLDADGVDRWVRIPVGEDEARDGEKGMEVEGAERKHGRAAEGPPMDDIAVARTKVEVET